MAYLWEACNPEGVAVASLDIREGDYMVGAISILDVPMPAQGDVHARCGVILLGKHEKRIFGFGREGQGKGAKVVQTSQVK